MLIEYVIFFWDVRPRNLVEGRKCLVGICDLLTVRSMV